MHFRPLGDRAITITLGSTIDGDTHRLVRAVSTALEHNPPAGLLDQVPAFASVTIHYDPARVEPGHDRTVSPYASMVATLTRQLSQVQANSLPKPAPIEIPVCYGGAYGPDLEEVAAWHTISPEAVVSIHACAMYFVALVGFMPGFAYLGGLPSEIATPRRSSPRTMVPAGSVGIGGPQTGVYPADSPGGWNLIGRTPVRMFDLARETPSLLATGDRVRFTPISAEAFRQWREPA
jgi:inhibitor of KinA